VSETEKYSDPLPFLYIQIPLCLRGFSVSIVTRLRDWRPGFNAWQELWWDLFSHCVSKQTFTQRIAVALTLRVKRPGREADH